MARGDETRRWTEQPFLFCLRGREGGAGIADFAGWEGKCKQPLVRDQGLVRVLLDRAAQRLPEVVVVLQYDSL